MGFELFLAIALAFISLFTDEQLAQFLNVGAPLLIGLYVWRRMSIKATSAAQVLPVQALTDYDYDFLDDDQPEEPSHALADRYDELYDSGILQDECNARNDEWYEERQHH